MPRLLALALLAPLALPSFAQDEDPVWKADLEAARAFADVLKRAGEPPVESLTLVQGLAELVGDPRVPRQPASESSLCIDWVLPGGTGDFRLLFEDSLTRTLRPRRPASRTRPARRPVAPSDFSPVPLRTVTEWWTDGRRYRDACRGEAGAWKLAHWAAWHTRLKDDAMAVACWRAAVDVLGGLRIEFPRAPAADRLVLAAARSIAAGSAGSDEAGMCALERLEALAREKLDPEVAAEVAALLERLETRSAEARAALESRRKADAAQAAWVGTWLAADPSGLEKSGQAEYWIRGLLAWKCDSFESAAGGTVLDAFDRPGAGPCRELVALGMDALPALVAAACEPWPTRTRSGDRTVTVGDACALLIERITDDAVLPRAPGEVLPGRSLDAEKRRAAVEEWWRELQPLDPERRWVVLWKRGSEVAVRELLLRDPARYLPDMVERADRETGRRRELERRRLSLALSALPESRLRELEDSLPDACGQIVRAARSR